MYVLWYTLSVIASTLLLLLLYIFRKPLPRLLDDKQKVRYVIAWTELFGLVGIIREYLGYGHRWLWLRMFERPEYVTTTRVEHDVKFYDTHFDGVRVRIYEPVTGDVSVTSKRPGILFYHGGGWCLATVVMYHRHHVKLCKNTGCVVVAVEYCRAPENPFPLPLLDCLTAARHFFAHAENFGVDVTRIAVMGDSAGGNLAAAVCLNLRDTNIGYRPRLQVLIYPILQALDFQLPSYRNSYQMITSQRNIATFTLFYAGLENVDSAHVINNKHVSLATKQKYRELIEYLPAEYRQNYSMAMSEVTEELAGQFEKFGLDPYFAPLMADSLADLPEAYILTAGYDVLRDEGIMYANKLRHHGVEVTLVNKETAVHGCWSMDIPSAVKHRWDTYEYIKHML